MSSAEQTAGARVLIVEDDEVTRTLLTRMLELEGFDVCAVGTASQAVVEVSLGSPAIVLLDLQLPDADGLALLDDIRRLDPQMGCIIVSGREEEASRVLGLKLGADDYVVKPFSSAELLARVGSVLRRTRRSALGSMLERGDLCIDLSSREVRLRGEPVELTAKEFSLLVFLASSPRQVFTREQLLQHVWSSSAEWQDGATVTEHVRRLRRKLEKDPDQPTLIETVRSVGYRFTV